MSELFLRFMADNVGLAFGLALVLYGPVTLLSWERGPYRLIERVRLLAPDGSELDLLLSCGVCLTPSVVAVAVLGVWFLDVGFLPVELLALHLMCWAWMWILIRMTRFGKA